jgi:hypothetical protein
MDRRSQSSLTHRIVSEVLGLVLVASALAVGTVPNLTASQFTQALAVYAVVFTFAVLVWWQLGGMAAVGMLRTMTNNVLGMLVAFAIALLPVFLRLLIAEPGDLQTISGRALPVCFALVALALAYMIRTSAVYQSKRQWRLVHHSLWAAGALFIATIFIPYAMNLFSVLPLRVLAWFLILMIPLIARRMGVSLVATPARPPSPRPAENVHIPSADAPRNLSAANSNSEANPNREEGQERRRRSHGHYRHRRQGGSRRRV